MTWISISEDYFDKNYIKAIGREMLLGSKSKIDLSSFSKDAINNFYVSLIIEYEDTDTNKIYYRHHPYSGCYGFLRGGTEFKVRERYQIRAFYTALRYKSDKVKLPDLYRYWDYLLDPKISPYRNLIKNGVELVKAKGNTGPYIKVNVSNGQNLQFIISFFMNMRLGRDNPAMLRMFNRLLDNDFTEHEALYTSIYYNLNESGSITPGIYGDGKGFYAYADNDISLFKKGKPKLEKQYTLAKGYLYISRIWLKDPNKYQRAVQISMPDCSIYRAFNAVSDYDGVFNKAYSSSHEKMSLGPSPKFEELVEKKSAYIE